MLIEKKAVISKVNYGISHIVLDKEKSEEMAEYVNQAYNMSTGDVMDYIAGRLPVNKDTNIFTLFILADGLDKVRQTNILKESFTEIEIKEFSKSKIEEAKIEFPIEIPCIQISDDQWIGCCSAKFLMQLRDSQLINYNVNAQRTMQRVKRGDSEFFRIAINKKAVRAIKESLQSELYIPNTITLNIPENETDFYYVKDKSVLVIRNIKAFDIADGYHRYLAISQLHDANPDFDYPLELRVINFSDDKTKQFIFQEDQKTKMRQIDSDSMNMGDPCNRVVEKLNRNVMFDLYGQISRNEGKINYAELSQVISYFYYKKDGQSYRSKEYDAQFVATAVKELTDKLNMVIESSDKLLNEPIDFMELMVIFYCISHFSNIKEAISHITTGIDNISKLDKAKFATKKPRKGMLKDIERII